MACKAKYCKCITAPVFSCSAVPVCTDILMYYFSHNYGIVCLFFSTSILQNEIYNFNMNSDSNR